jgi:hypothetical protein
MPRASPVQRHHRDYSGDGIFDCEDTQVTTIVMDLNVVALSDIG